MVGFFAVPNQNNGNESIFKKGLAAVPLQKNGTNFSGQIGFSNVANKNTGKICIIKKSWATVLLPESGSNFVYHDGFAAKPKIFSFFSDKNLKIQFFVRFDNFVSRTFSNGYTTLGGRGHRFILTLETRFPRIKTYKLKYRLCFTFKSTSTFLYF